MLSLLRLVLSLLMLPAYAWKLFETILRWLQRLEPDWQVLELFGSFNRLQPIIRSFPLKARGPKLRGSDFFLLLLCCLNFWNIVLDLLHPVRESILDHLPFLRFFVNFIVQNFLFDLEVIGVQLKIQSLFLGLGLLDLGSLEYLDLLRGLRIQPV